MKCSVCSVVMAEESSTLKHHLKTVLFFVIIAVLGYVLFGEQVTKAIDYALGGD